jgi:hypothetical protein
MRRASLLWEVYVRRFEVERYRKRRPTADEAGELEGSRPMNASHIATGTITALISTALV